MNSAKTFEKNTHAHILPTSPRQVGRFLSLYLALYGQTYSNWEINAVATILRNMLTHESKLK